MSGVFGELSEGLDAVGTSEVGTGDAVVEGGEPMESGASDGGGASFTTTASGTGAICVGTVVGAGPTTSGSACTPS